MRTMPGRRFPWGGGAASLFLKKADGGEIGGERGYRWLGGVCRISTRLLKSHKTGLVRYRSLMMVKNLKKKNGSKRKGT